LRLGAEAHGEPSFSDPGRDHFRPSGSRSAWLWRGIMLTSYHV